KHRVYHSIVDANVTVRVGPRCQDAKPHQAQTQRRLETAPDLSSGQRVSDKTGKAKDLNARRENRTASARACDYKWNAFGRIVRGRENIRPSSRRTPMNGLRVPCKLSREVAPPVRLHGRDPTLHERNGRAFNIITTNS